MIQQTPVMRICISCRKTYDRKLLLKITKDHKLGIIFQKGMGRSAYICKTKKCCSDSKIKKSFKSFKTFLEPEFIDIFEKKSKAIMTIPIRNIIKLNYLLFQKVQTRLNDYQR